MKNIRFILATPFLLLGVLFEGLALTIGGELVVKIKIEEYKNIARILIKKGVIK